MTGGARGLAIVLVVLEVGTAVVVNLATAGKAWWLWPLLAALVMCTCLAVWLRDRRHPVGTRAPKGQVVLKIEQTASFWGVIRRSPVRARKLAGRVRQAARFGGTVEDSGIDAER